MAVTLNDIVKEAGFSFTKVSLVLNFSNKANKDNKKIEAITKVLNYLLYPRTKVLAKNLELYGVIQHFKGIYLIICNLLKKC